MLYFHIFVDAVEHFSRQQHERNGYHRQDHADGGGIIHIARAQRLDRHQPQRTRARLSPVCQEQGMHIDGKRNADARHQDHGQRGPHDRQCDMEKFPDKADAVQMRRFDDLRRHARHGPPHQNGVVTDADPDAVHIQNGHGEFFVSEPDGDRFARIAENVHQDRVERALADGEHFGKRLCKHRGRDQVRQKDHDDDKSRRGYFFIQNVCRKQLQGNGDQKRDGPVAERIPNRLYKIIAVDRREIAEKLSEVSKPHEFFFVGGKIYVLESHQYAVDVDIDRKYEKLRDGQREHTENKEFDLPGIFDLYARML